MPRQKIATADLLSGLALSALGIYIIWQSSHWKFFGSEGPGPGFFPFFYGGLMAAVALYIALRSLRGAEGKSEEPRDYRGTIIALLTWVGLALSIPLMMVLGFVPGFAVFTFALIRLAFGQSYLRSLIAGIAIPATLYLVFAVLLQTDLPESMFWGF